MEGINDVPWRTGRVHAMYLMYRCVKVRTSSYVLVVGRDTSYEQKPYSDPPGSDRSKLRDGISMIHALYCRR